ncbi:unnamed protein product [Adineta steineri]|uniref:Uncharacterized protein n=1 Tax=Adineta steineri TaxID=433720 RepID=A0A820G4C1_9BILA|nr:unnamed protein product [Adineta steineri]
MSMRECFQKTIKTLRGTSTTIISQLSNDDDTDCSSYYLLHPYLVLLPGVETTFLPIKKKYKILIYEYFQWTIKSKNQYLHLKVLLFNNVQRVQSGRCSMEKTIYDKLNLTTDLPNKDHTTYLDRITKDYCMKRVSIDSPTIKHISHLLPSPNQILNNELNSIINQDLIEPIVPFNELAAYYAQMAIKDLDLNQQHHPLLNTCRSLVSILHSKQIVTWHSIQLHLIELIERLSRLEPYLII